MLFKIYETLSNLFNSLGERNKYSWCLSSFEIYVENCEQEIKLGNIENARSYFYMARGCKEILLNLKGTHPMKLGKIKSKVESLESRIKELANKKV